MSQTTDRPAAQDTGNFVVDSHPSPTTAQGLASPPRPEAPVVGDPGMIGIPAFMVGSIALGLVNIGFVPAAAGGAAIPIILAATGLGQLIAAIWAARLAENASAAVFSIFAGFWLSYGFLVLGLDHGWLAVDAASAARTQELFLISWLAVVVLLTLASLRMPLAFTVLFVLVDLALLLVLLGTAQASTTLVAAGGYAVFAFVLVGAYLFVNGMSTATGGPDLPLGRPVLR